MVFEEIHLGGCRSYLIGCEQSCVAALVDPALEHCDRYPSLAATRGLRISCLIDTHTHADHFSALSHLKHQLGVEAIMHRASPAPFVDVGVEDGETIALGSLRLRVLHTPGHTLDSMCLVVEDRVLTGDTLLLGSVGRTDLPGGNADALYDSLVSHLLRLEPGLLVYPAHNYRDTPVSTLGEQGAANPRIAGVTREEFVSRMRSLDLALPEHLTEALRTNASGGKPVSQLIHEATRSISFISMDELRGRLDRPDPGVALVDVREAHRYAAGRIRGATHIPRGQLELLIDAAFPDPRARILTYCDWGKVSTLAAATLRTMGFAGAVALDGGFMDWVKEGYPVEVGPPDPPIRLVGRNA
jgi:glyoxylase-like metal-dependent hydrolase (beta-lactamase superfamily II)/rhodanese-related sulfurtransferase